MICPPDEMMYYRYIHCCSKVWNNLNSQFLRGYNRTALLVEIIEKILDDYTYIIQNGGFLRGYIFHFHRQKSARTGPGDR